MSEMTKIMFKATLKRNKTISKNMSNCSICHNVFNSILDYISRRLLQHWRKVWTWCGHLKPPKSQTIQTTLEKHDKQLLLLQKYFQLYWIVILRDLRMCEKDYMKVIDLRMWPARVWNPVNSYPLPSCILLYATFHNYKVKDLTTLAISQIQTLSENSAASGWIFERNK